MFRNRNDMLLIYLHVAFDYWPLGPPMHCYFHEIYWLTDGWNGGCVNIIHTFATLMLNVRLKRIKTKSQYISRETSGIYFILVYCVLCIVYIEFRAAQPLKRPKNQNSNIDSVAFRHINIISIVLHLTFLFRKLFYDSSAVIISASAIFIVNKCFDDNYNLLKDPTKQQPQKH